ncbi:MAG TPA: hypothetical protein V6C76_06515 [Drouetiella sp.]
MTTIIEKTDSGNSAVGMILGFLLAIALLAGGLYFYNSGGLSHTETNTTTVLPAPSDAPAPSVNITNTAPAPAPAPPSAESSTSSQ